MSSARISQAEVESSMESAATGMLYGPHHDPFLFCGQCLNCRAEDKLFYEKSLRQVLEEDYKLREFNPNREASGQTEISSSCRVFQRIFCHMQGILVPLDVPVFQLWRIFAHADLFLYAIVTCEN